MVQMENFGVERWMEANEQQAVYNLAETCCSSISIEELKSICGDSSDAPVIQYSTKLTYGEVRGSESLRSNISHLYGSSGSRTSISTDDVLITPGAISALHLAFYALVGPNDHVISHYPTYQTLYSSPASLGASVSFWKAQEHKNWTLDIAELESLIQPNTRLIVINNPHNPTGAVLSRDALSRIVDLASKRGITILSDEVYRPIFHQHVQEPPPSLLELDYERTIVVGSLSKAYALAGIRVGWLATRDTGAMNALISARDYTTISVSQLDEQVAAYALAPGRVDKLLARNKALAAGNLAILEKFVSSFAKYCEFVTPAAGTTAFVKFVREGEPVDAEAFCRRLMQEAGVLLVPGDVGFGREFKGFVRVGYVCETTMLVEGLDSLIQFLGEGFSDVPLAG